MSKSKLVRDFVALAKEQGFVEYCSTTGRQIPLTLSAQSRIDALFAKIKTNDVDLSRMSWEYCVPGEATTTHANRTYYYDVPPNIYLVGEVVVGEITHKFFKKFVSHPFYQLGRVAYRTQPIES